MSDIMCPNGYIDPCDCLDHEVSFDSGFDPRQFEREYKARVAYLDERLDQNERTIRELNAKDDFLIGEVIEKPKVRPEDFDKQEMKKRELSILEKKLSKAERDLERLTGKVDKPAKPDWAEDEDCLNMVVRRVFFGFYACWVTSIGMEAKRGTKFYARNPYNAYLIARKVATRGAREYFLSSNIRFENF